jgi:hypothetical protein
MSEETCGRNHVTIASHVKQHNLKLSLWDERLVARQMPLLSASPEYGQRLWVHLNAAVEQ